MRDKFQQTVWQKGRELYRDMPWRQDTRPYYVLVSELMLQQTQVSRVIPKFLDFIEAFPSEHELAAASLGDVLRQWQGLGYNRRAKFLHEAAKMVVEQNTFPETYESLMKLPGVGKNTAGAIMAYSFNYPSIFVETNIRTVYFHHFFEGTEQVDDKQIIEKLTETIDREHPREFYWALMDYGSWLKSEGAGRLTQSRHYTKQKALKGSVRETRGVVIRLLSESDRSETELRDLVDMPDRYEGALQGLIDDGLVVRTKTVLHLTK